MTAKAKPQSVKAPIGRKDIQNGCAFDTSGTRKEFRVYVGEDIWFSAAMC